MLSTVVPSSLVIAHERAKVARLAACVRSCDAAAAACTRSNDADVVTVGGPVSLRRVMSLNSSCSSSRASCCCLMSTSDNPAAAISASSCNAVSSAAIQARSAGRRLDS